MADAGSDNPYIRTYAKDFAALSGKPQSPTATLTPPPADTAAPSPESDRDAVLTRLRERAVKDPVSESQLLPNKLPTPQPIAEALPTQNPPEPVHSELPPPPPAPVLTPPPLPPTPIPPPPPPIPLTPKLAPPPAKPEGPSPIHTYTSDFADRIDQDKASTFSVLAAQSDAAPHQAMRLPSGPAFRNIGIAVAGIVLVILGGGGAYAAYRYVASRGFVPVLPTVPSLIFADDRQMLSGEGRDLLEALATSAANGPATGEVRVVYIAVATSTPDGGTTNTPLTGGRLVGALQLTAPDILLRNIGPESTVGVVHAGEESRAFFILKVLSYERTFAGMLQWERDMQDDLAVLYPLYPEAPLAAPTIATTTKVVNGKTIVATTTVAAPLPRTDPPRFIDEIVANHDVRALKDGAGRTILLYGYKGKDLLVIARDEAAFTELVRRLSATKQQ